MVYLCVVTQTWSVQTSTGSRCNTLYHLLSGSNCLFEHLSRAHLPGKHFSIPPADHKSGDLVNLSSFLFYVLLQNRQQEVLIFFTHPSWMKQPAWACGHSSHPQVLPDCPVPRYKSNCPLPSPSPPNFVFLVRTSHSDVVFRKIKLVPQ